MQLWHTYKGPPVVQHGGRNVASPPVTFLTVQKKQHGLSSQFSRLPSCSRWREKSDAISQSIIELQV